MKSTLSAADQQRVVTLIQLDDALDRQKQTENKMNHNKPTLYEYNLAHSLTDYNRRAIPLWLQAAIVIVVIAAVCLLVAALGDARAAGLVRGIG